MKRNEAKQFSPLNFGNLKRSVSRAKTMKTLYFMFGRLAKKQSKNNKVSPLNLDTCKDAEQKQ